MTASPAASPITPEPRKKDARPSPCRIMVSLRIVGTPFGKGKKWMRDANKVVNGALGNWELNVIQTLENGIPHGYGFAGFVKRLPARRV